MDENQNAEMWNVLTDRMWRELVERLPESELGRIRGLLDVMAGRTEPVLQPMQGSLHGLFMPNLPSTPWLPQAMFEDIVGELERAFPELRSEVLEEINQARGFRPYGQITGEPDMDHDDVPDGWGELRLWEDLKPTEAVLRMPRAARTIQFILSRWPASPLLNHVAFLSMKPNTRLPLHADRANWYVSVHMGIVVPENCGIRVGGEARTWQEGKCITFDNSFFHEAWNDGDKTRITFGVYLAHPGVTATEREALRILHARYQALRSAEAIAAWASGGVFGAPIDAA